MSRAPTVANDRTEMTLASPLSGRHLAVARRNLSAFVREQAETAAHRLKFGWRGSELAPGSFEALRHEHRSSELSGLPLRVSAHFSERTIYDAPEVSHAMRFWHDTSHVQLGLDFTPDCELELGCYHLEVLRSYGFGASTIEHRLLHADTIGQTLCTVTLGRFPIDQLRFASLVVGCGINEAIANEIAHTEAY